MKRFPVLALCLCALLVFAAAEGSLPPPSADFYCYDDADVLSVDTKAVIYFNNAVLFDACGAQIVVAAVQTTADTPIDRYAAQLFNAWGVGDAERNNGYLLLMAIGDDDYYLVQGYGSEDITTPEELADLLWEYLEPDFAQSRYGEGAVKVVRKLFDVVCDYYGLALEFDETPDISSIPSGTSATAYTVPEAAASGGVSVGVMTLGAIAALILILFLGVNA